ncbi:hypothetical protein AY599_22955 [Leptolyngbya valderiana BDU 20041]|nr:hypothetical protein AY599_22955 [Leptolyngbya valderiana BDU 20041]
MAFYFYYNISFFIFYLLSRSINIFANKKLYNISVLLKIPSILKMLGIWQNLEFFKNFIL